MSARPPARSAARPVSGGETTRERRATLLARVSSWRNRAAVPVAMPAILALLGLTLLSRVALLAFGWPPTDSDEATMGIMALHIGGQGECPIFFYGQQYMGVLEAYLAAGAFHVFGPSLFALRLGALLMSMAALGAIYLLARRLYSPGLALLCLGLLALGPAEPLLRELWAGGGYAETLLCGSLVMLLATWLAQTSTLSQPITRSLARRLLRLGAFAGWGLAAGVGLWSDLLVLPYVLAAGLLLVGFCWREWRAAAPCLLAGLLAGAFPLLTYALSAPDHNPFAGALAVSRSSDAWRGDVLAQVVGQVVGTFAVAVPNMTGGAALCALPQADQWPLAHATPSMLLCTGAHALWGLSFVVLLGLAGVSAGVSAMRALRRGRQGGAREAFATEAARLALVVGAALTLLLFLASPVAARIPHLDSRYLIGLLIALPVILAPLWRSAEITRGIDRFMVFAIRAQLIRPADEAGLAPTQSLRVARMAQGIDGLRSVWTRLWANVWASGHALAQHARLRVHAGDGRDESHPYRGRQPFRAPRRDFRRQPVYSRRVWAARLVLAAIVVTYLLAFAGVLGTIPAAQAERQQRAALVSHLEQTGVSYVYSEYWTCGWLIFSSREGVICAALNAKLRPDLDRYPPYRAQVAAAPNAAYVFPVSSAQAVAFADRLQATPAGPRYTREVYAGYVIYRPPPAG